MFSQGEGCWALFAWSRESPKLPIEASDEYGDHKVREKRTNMQTRYIEINSCETAVRKSASVTTESFRTDKVKNPR
jgi:hypothetical protein